jgi:hypothetical protein
LTSGCGSSRGGSGSFANIILGRGSGAWLSAVQPANAAAAPAIANTETIPRHIPPFYPMPVKITRLSRLTLRPCPINIR